MDWNAVAGLALRYTFVAAVVTVGAASLAFESGPALLVLAGAGVVLAVLGVGQAGAAPASGVEQAENTNQGGLVEGMDMLPGSGADYSIRVKLLFYGAGLVVWSIVGLAILLG